MTDPIFEAYLNEYRSTQMTNTRTGECVRKVNGKDVPCETPEQKKARHDKWRAENRAKGTKLTGSPKHNDPPPGATPATGLGQESWTAKLEQRLNEMVDFDEDPAPEIQKGVDDAVEQHQLDSGVEDLTRWNQEDWEEVHELVLSYVDDADENEIQDYIDRLKQEFQPFDGSVDEREHHYNVGPGMTSPAPHGMGPQPPHPRGPGQLPG